MRAIREMGGVRLPFPKTCVNQESKILSMNSDEMSPPISCPPQKLLQIFSAISNNNHTFQMSAFDKLLDCQSLEMEELQERIRYPLNLTTLPHYL